ncbi:hypothetical protein [uncultured Alistipes sp.]|uniref:hypothetical protein n=1 Tax=uncultured Alistipes sp. TaxID=538949 RepID=UPI0025955FDA|nr:hypothetical protein [uncultured Alistipes sp.]
MFAENPGIAPGSGFKPPHSRLQRKKDNRGLRPWGTLYFLAAKSTKNSPADAFAYFVPSNVRNGRLFAGLQANRPRFLPLLAGPSFHGSGIGPGSFAAIPSFRPGKEANTRTREHANMRTGANISCSRVRGESRHRPWKRFSTAAFSLAAEKEQPTARVPGAGGCKGLILLRPLNAGRRLFPRKRHADGFGTFAIKSTEKAATMSRVFCTFFPQKELIAVCDWCCLPLFGRQKAAQKPTRRQKRLKDAA